jgi:hypothetical protein
MKQLRKLTILTIFVALLLLLYLPSGTNEGPDVVTTNDESQLCLTSTAADPFALENNGIVYNSLNGSNPWTQTGNAPVGYEFVSTATDNNHTYVLTSDGQIWRHFNASWNSPTWSLLQVPLPRTSTGWKSIDVSQNYTYVLHADGDVYRIPKDPGWPNPGVWVQCSNPIPLFPPIPAMGGETSYVSIAVDWWDMFCFVLRNNGQIFRHECDGSPLGGSWTNPASQWDIYASYFVGMPPFVLEHGDGSGLYWGIPSTGWVSIDVFDNTVEMNYTVYALHSSGLVARHTNYLGWAIDVWMSPMVPWELDPRWPIDWVGPWGTSTAFESIACNDLDIFIMKNTGEVFFVPEADFLPMLVTGPTWLWGPSPLLAPPETATSAFVSIDAWTEPFILKNDGKEWRNLYYRTAPYWDDCYDNNQNNGQGTLYPNVFAYSSIAAYNQSILFMLSKNGSIYRSVDAGVNWQKFGDLGYGNDSAWVSIAAPNFMNHSYIYALYNNGTVARTTATTFAPQTWGVCHLGLPDTSWVSIACDGNATVYTLRNFGSISYRSQGNPWQSKGITVGDKAHQDSSWDCIEAYHTSYGVFALRNDFAMDTSAAGSSAVWSNINPAIPYTNHIALCLTPTAVLVLTNNGQVSNMLGGFGNIPGDTGFVDICSFIDNIPWDNNPPDITVSNMGSPLVTWTIYDDVALDTYIIWENGSTVNWGTSGNPTETVGAVIANQLSRVLNYTIFYNDTAGQSNMDTVFITVDLYPWGNSSGSLTTAYNDTIPANVRWTLYDDRGPNHYQIWVNGSPSGWNTWTNGSTPSVAISRTSLGITNYTIEFNDTRNQFTIDTVLITVNDPYAPWSNNPAPIITTSTGSETIDWQMYDGWSPGYFYVLVNDNPSIASTWTNGNNIHYPIDRSAPGQYNYTIAYNDSVGNPGTPHTVWVTIVDQSPWSNSTGSLATIYNDTTPTHVQWNLYDDWGGSHFCLWHNGTPTGWTIWNNGSSVSYPILRNSFGVYNYTIAFNDTGNQFTIDTVWITVQDPYPPWSNSPAPILTNATGSETVDWQLWDGLAGGQYYVLVNNSPSPSAPWTNGTNLHYPIDRTTAGIFNYTIIYTDSAGNHGLPNTVWVEVQLPSGNGGIPGFQLFFVLVSIVSLAAGILQKTRIEFQ